jgi:hypothetical protein
MSADLLNQAIERKIPLHIVTLTRATCDKDGNVLAGEYMPISVTEAAMYTIDGKLVQEYNKGSYYQECDSALKNWYTYLFGNRLDFPHNSHFIKLLSTQICYDLQSKVRFKQENNPAPIHIFQSNTHELSRALSRLKNASDPFREDIPGRPRKLYMQILKIRRFLLRMRRYLSFFLVMAPCHNSCPKHIIHLCLQEEHLLFL